MGVAVLVFSLAGGIFQFQGDASAPVYARKAASEQQAPAGDTHPHRQAEPADQSAPTQPSSDSSETGTEASSAAGGSGNNLELAQFIADEIAANPPGAASVMTTALARTDGTTTLGDVAIIAAAAARAAPGEGPAIAGAVTRALKDRGAAVLAAAVATIVSLVPEQSREIGLVVGATIGEDLETLAMVAQTVAISTGESCFDSLSEASGVSRAALMRASSEFGSAVPFDVPAYAAQHAPGPSRVADGATLPAVGSQIDREM